MASPLVSAPEAAFWSPPFTKRLEVLKHLSHSQRDVKVCPASQLEVRPRPEMLSSGISELDAISGGIPCGCLTVFWGGASSGKTSALMATFARNTQEEGTCVLIDASDSFDPKSADAAGVNLARLLWVRCGERGKSWVLGPWSSAKSRGLSAEHSAATPEGQEQTANSERRTTNSQRRIPPRRTTYDIQRSLRSQSAEHRLDQVLKSTDLILQSGGFGLVVLDLAGIPEKYVRRIPLASWFRFQRTVEHTKTALLVISEFVCAQSCAALAVQLSAAGSQLPVAPTINTQRPAHAELLQEMRIEAEVTRSRLERKPMQSVRAQFATKTARAG